MFEMLIEQSVTFNLPAQLIFDYMTDLDNWVEWSVSTIAVRKIVPGNIRVGTSWRCTSRFLGRWSESTYELVGHEPFHFFTLKSTSGLAPSIFSFDLKQNRDGRTNLSLEARVHHVDVFLGLHFTVIENAFRRQLAGDLQTLRDILESRPSIMGKSG